MQNNSLNNNGSNINSVNNNLRLKRIDRQYEVVPITIVRSNQNNTLKCQLQPTLRYQEYLKRQDKSLGTGFLVVIQPFDVDDAGNVEKNVFTEHSCTCGEIKPLGRICKHIAFVLYNIQTYISTPNFPFHNYVFNRACFYSKEFYNTTKKLQTGIDITPLPFDLKEWKRNTLTAMPLLPPEPRARSRPRNAARFTAGHTSRSNTLAQNEAIMTHSHISSADNTTSTLVINGDAPTNGPTEVVDDCYLICQQIALMSGRDRERNKAYLKNPRMCSTCQIAGHYTDKCTQPQLRIAFAHQNDTKAYVTQMKDAGSDWSLHEILNGSRCNPDNEWRVSDRDFIRQPMSDDEEKDDDSDDDDDDVDDDGDDDGDNSAFLGQAKEDQ